jgi:signal transduction histidine kinase
LLRYFLTMAATIAALAVAYFFHGFLGTPLPYILLFPVVAFSAWYCGVGPAVMASALVLAGLRYWFVTPLHSFRVPDNTQSICLLAFVVPTGLPKCDNSGANQERTVELDNANSGLRDLSARLLQSQDEERRRLARELHDSVGQLLAALSMNLANVRDDIERLNKTAATLTDSEALVQEMNREVRTISHLLHPPLLDEAGLESAVRWYVDGFAQRSNIKVNLDLPKEIGRLPREMETALFRIVQECLTQYSSSLAKFDGSHSAASV